MAINVTPSNDRDEACPSQGPVRKGVRRVEGNEALVAPDGWHSTAEDFHRVGLAEQENRLAVIRVAARRSTGALAQSQLQAPNAQNHERLVTVVNSVYRVMDPRRRPERLDQIRVGRILPLDLQSTMIFERVKRHARLTDNAFLVVPSTGTSDSSAMESESASDSLYDLIADADRILKNEMPVAVDMVATEQTREQATAPAGATPRSSVNATRDVGAVGFDIPDPQGTLHEARQFVREVRRRRSWLPTAWIARHRFGLATLITCVCVAAFFLSQWQHRLDQRRHRFQANLGPATRQADGDRSQSKPTTVAESSRPPSALKSGRDLVPDRGAADHSNSLQMELEASESTRATGLQAQRIDEADEEAGTNQRPDLNKQERRNRLRQNRNGSGFLGNDLAMDGDDVLANRLPESPELVPVESTSTTRRTGLAAEPVSRDELRDAIDTMIKDTNNLVSRFNVAGASQLISHWERRSKTAVPGSADELAALHLCMNAAWLSERFAQVRDRAIQIATLQNSQPRSVDHEVAVLLIDSLLETTKRLTVTRDLNRMLLQANRCVDQLIVSTQHEVPLSCQSDIQAALRFADDADGLADLEGLLGQLERLPSRHDVAALRADEDQRGAFGRYACLQQRDWTNGLNALTHHVDTFLSATANAEQDVRFDASSGALKEPNAGELAVIGLRWSRVARRFQGREAAAIRLHAIELMSGDPAYADDIQDARRQLPSYLIVDPQTQAAEDASSDARIPVDNSFAIRRRF
ncbi:MAG: hypothetical protein AAGD07_16815 [Planctomycetota bacterium]